MGKPVKVKAHIRRSPKERKPKREKSLIKQAAEDTYKGLSKRLSGKS